MSAVLLGLLGYDASRNGFSRLQTYILPLASVTLYTGGSLLVILAYAFLPRHRGKVGTQFTFCQAICDLILGFSLLLSLPRFMEWKWNTEAILLQQLAYHASTSYGFVMCFLVARMIYNAQHFKAINFRLGACHLYVISSALINSLVPYFLGYLDTFESESFFGIVSAKFPFYLQLIVHLAGSVSSILYSIFATNRNFRFGNFQNRIPTLLGKYGMVFLCFWTIPIAVCLIHTYPNVSFPFIFCTLIAKFWMYF